MRDSGWVKPYTVERRGTGTFFWQRYYAVMFDGTELASSLYHDEARHLAAMCNGAYNLGRFDQMLEFQLEAGHGS